MSRGRGFPPPLSHSFGMVDPFGPLERVGGIPHHILGPLASGYGPQAP
jgi:hypothetical protein